MAKLLLPSGVEITLVSLLMQVSSLTSEDVEFIFETGRAKKFRKPIAEFLGKAFSGSYSHRRKIVTGKYLDFWKLRRGAFQKKFRETAIDAKQNGINIQHLILCAEDFARLKRLGYPTPNLVCGSYVFSTVINGWVPEINEVIPQDEQEEIETTKEQGETSWIWQPGFAWNEELGQFVKSGN